MAYYATKNGITRANILPNQIWEYEQHGWTITTDNVKDVTNTYEDVNGNRLEPITINGEEFIGYSSFACVNTKTYVVEPERTYDGSIPNINQYDTFVVPRVKISFDYMTIHDFRRFLKAVAPNEFPVTYYDYEIDSMVTYKMYLEPREMAKIYNKGFKILGITGEEISLIATLNDIDYIQINYYDNVTNIQANPNYKGDYPNDYILLDTKDMVFGNWYIINDGSQYMHNLQTDKKKYKFLSWNTKPDGTGDIRYLSAETIRANGANMNLYAQWELIK